MDDLPAYVSVVFIITTFLTVGIFLYAVRQSAFESKAAKILIFLIFFQLIFQTVIASGGVYQNTAAFPPRLFLLGVFPALLTIIFLFIFARRQLIEKLPLKTLTWIHVVRIVVEIVLYWLAAAKAIPELMTFAGRNFDILSGLTTPFVVWIAFRGGKINRPLLIVWNLLALGLLFIIVVNAILSAPFSFQRFAFEQPNRAILYFPYVWLPTVIVPIILFSHLASLWKLWKPARL